MSNKLTIFINQLRKYLTFYFLPFKNVSNPVFFECCCLPPINSHWNYGDMENYHTSSDMKYVVFLLVHTYFFEKFCLNVLSTIKYLSQFHSRTLIDILMSHFYYSNAFVNGQEI